jgi:WD40 repeat protein
MVALDAAARATLLDERCAGDADVRREVEALIVALDAGEGALAPGRGLDLVARADKTNGATLPKLRGDYRILRVLGEGGMGVVYEAEQTMPRRNVALKAVRPGFVSRAMLERLEREAHILGRLQHPCIAQIYEAGTDLPERGLQAFIAMELVDGPPITAWATVRSVREKVEILARVCDAVQHAHERRVIHRDLKPSNILVDASSTPKVLDFGVARVFDADVLDGALRTNAGMLVGTLAYMSPEQVSGDPDAIDTRTDVYALGVLLYELLTGRLPHATHSRSLPEMVLAVRDEPVTRLGTIDASLRGDLDAIAAKTLEKDRDRRYASAAELAQDLRRHLAGEPILARGDSGFYVLRRQVSKHRVTAIASALVVVALAVAAVEYAIRARHESRLHAEAVALTTKLDRALRESDVERARLLGLTGNLAAAEAILWPAQIARPEEPTRWALWELYSRYPCLRSLGEVDDTVLGMCTGRTSNELLMSSHDGAIRACDLATGVTSVRVPGRGILIPVLIGDSAHGRVWAGLEDGTFRAYDLTTGAELRRYDTHSEGVWCARFTPDFTRVALSCSGGKVQIVDVATLALLRELAGHKGATRGIVFAPDGRLWTGGEDGHLRIWNAQTGALISDVMEYPRAITSLDTVSGGQRIGVACEDGTITLFDSADARQLAHFDAEAGGLRSITCSTDGRAWIAAGFSRTTLWTVDGEPHREATYGQNCFMGIFCNEGRTIATGAARGPTRVWERSPTPCVSTFGPKLRAGMPCGIERAGKMAATVDDQGRLELMEMPSGRLLGRTEPLSTKFACFGVDERGEHASTGERDGTLRAFEAPGGREIWSKTTGELSLKSLRYSDDGRWLVAGKNGGTLFVFDSATGAERAKVETGLGDVDCAIFDERAEQVYATHRGHVVSCWRVADQQQVMKLDAPSAVASMLLLAGGKQLAVATWLGPVEVWDLETKARTELTGHSQRVRCFAQSPDQSLLVTGSEDGEVRLWEVATGSPLATFAANAGPIHDVGFATDGEPGRVLYSLHDDGVVRAWDLHRYDAHVTGNEEYQRRASAKSAAH